MKSKKKAPNAGAKSEKAIPTIMSEEQTSLGEIKINLHVVGQIVRLAASSVNGVAEVGSSGFGDTIAEMFSSKKESDRGVRVLEDEAGNYRIEIRVILQLGAELVNVAYAVQQSVHDQVTQMTNKSVSAVNVIIDGVKTKDETKETTDSKDDWSNAPAYTETE